MVLRHRYCSIPKTTKKNKMIETYKIEGTIDIPSVILDKENDIMEISGRFMHDDVTEIFNQIFDWFDDYAKEPNKKTILTLKMRYFNTAASKGFLDLMNQLEELKDAGNEVLIHWHSADDDPDMEEAGQEYAEMIDLPFEFFSYTIPD